jgi:DNA-binding beta-propeller fold protein YncE
VTIERRLTTLGLAALTILFVGASASSAALLVADRLSNSVYRYSNSGALLGTVLTDNANLIQPGGIGISPDQSKIYVASIGNNRVMQYDYNAGTGTASNPVVFADATDGLMFPNSVVFSPNGSTVYVSNLGGSGVARFNPDGSSAGAPLNGTIGGGAYFQFSGLAFAPSGELVVGAYKDFPGGTTGAIAKSNAARTALNDFIPGSPSLEGLTGLMVQGFNLYAAAGDAGNVRRYNVSTGELDAAFGLSGLEFPQGMVGAPDGNGFLLGILGATDGSGSISRYDYNGTLLSTFALPGGGGFTEPTAFVVYIPEPATGGMIGASLVPVVWLARRRIAG